jgi:enoyl-CoA hydratase/carnithine racemase
MHMAGLNVSSADGVARLCFDRPDALNALSPTMLQELIEVCATLAANDAVKVVRLEGAGRAFSAGADLPAFLAALTGSDARRVADLGRRATDALAMLPQITVAGIRGHCVGGGLVLAAACDVRIAADDAQFMIPELDAGIPLAWGGMAHLVRLAGETLAADLVLSCRPFGAAEGLEAGLISRVIPADDVDAQLDALTLAIAKRSSYVLRVTKRQLLEIRSAKFDASKDADALLGALGDSESVEQGMRYVSSRIRR